MVSRVLNCSPFDPALKEHTEPQLDFILEMHALDSNGEFTFIRPGVETPISSPASKAEWEQRLLDKAKTDFMAPRMPSAAVFEAAKRLAQARQLC